MINDYYFQGLPHKGFWLKQISLTNEKILFEGWQLPPQKPVTTSTQEEPKLTINNIDELELFFAEIR